MNVVVVVGGREAIPVRAISFVTGKMMSPDKVATVLSQEDRFTKMNRLQAYQLDAHGKWSPTLPKEWDEVVAQLDALQAQLKQDHPNDSIGYGEWQKSSPSALPEGVFVWKDEFVSAFEKNYSEENRIILGERPGDRQLVFMPMVPVNMQSVVLAGFGPVHRFNSSLEGSMQNPIAYVSLSHALAGDWEKPFDQLSTEIQERVSLWQLRWDQLNVVQRQKISAQRDYQDDPKLEPAVYFGLHVYLEELAGQETMARQMGNSAVALALVDVQKRLNNIYECDRERVGLDIQRLRSIHAISEGSTTVDTGDLQLPNELQIANAAFRAVQGGYGVATEKFKQRLIVWLEKHRPALSAEAKKRIATVANYDSTPGRTKKA